MTYKELELLIKKGEHGNIKGRERMSIVTLRNENPKIKGRFVMIGQPLEENNANLWRFVLDTQMQAFYATNSQDKNLTKLLVGDDITELSFNQ